MLNTATIVAVRIEPPLANESRRLAKNAVIIAVPAACKDELFVKTALIPYSIICENAAYIPDDCINIAKVRPVIDELLDLEALEISVGIFCIDVANDVKPQETEVKFTPEIIDTPTAIDDSPDPMSDKFKVV